MHHRPFHSHTRETAFSLAKRTQPTAQPDIADQLMLVVEAEEYRRSLKEFVKAAWHIVEPAPFVDGWCLDSICDHLTALTRGNFRFLLVNVPPRHTKSTVCSVLWPVWNWLQDPCDRFLCASYSLNLAIRDNSKKRNLIESPWFQQRYGNDFKLTMGNYHFTQERDFALTGEQNAKRFFTNDKLGYQLACSVGSSATGEGGSKLVVDDCHAASEAHSDAERESALIWFRETWSNRMNDASKDCMLTIGQRIHEDDVCGYIRKERPDWIHLNLPAEYEPHRKCITPIWQDPRTQEGELLWPERFNQETLNRYKRDLGSLGYAAQYQQLPVPSGGSIFRENWLRYFSIEGDYYRLETPEGTRSIAVKSCWRFTVVDLAISSKQSADYTVIQTWDVTPYGELLLIDQVRGHYNNPEQQSLIRQVYLRLHPDFVQIEATAYQLAIVQQLRDTPYRENGSSVSIPLREYRPVKDKVSRASTAAILVENGKMYFLKTLADLQEIKNEVLRFPLYSHDDIVDTISQAAEMIASPRIPLSGDEPPRTDWFHEAELRKQLEEKRSLLAQLTQKAGVH
jgi:predicted phage terminase large subunit-like protein